ncbi:hypothetical protein [Pseudomonas monteilii]|uniref:hypothetical protein n=1 Tax=Pseudomonas monteilii TaxID=76759 RepID=UPI003906C01C
MPSTHLKSVPLVLGAMIVLFAISFDSQVNFTGLHVMDGPAWFIGPRAVAHMIGFIGLIMCFWFFFISFAEKTTLRINLALGSLLPIIGMAYFWGPEFFQEKIGYLYALLALQMTPTYLAACYVAYTMKKLTPRLITPKGALVTAMCGGVAVSLYWELLQQRFIDVYGKPPRDYIQFGQILCDLTGIFIGCALLALIVTQLDKRQHLPHPLPA